MCSQPIPIIVQYGPVTRLTAQPNPESRKNTESRTAQPRPTCPVHPSPWKPHLAGQRHLYGHGDDLGQQAAVERHPEHSRVTVGVHQRHLRGRNVHEQSINNQSCHHDHLTILGMNCTNTSVQTSNWGSIPFQFKIEIASCRSDFLIFQATEMDMGLKLSKQLSDPELELDFNGQLCFYAYKEFDAVN